MGLFRPKQPQWAIDADNRARDYAEQRRASGKCMVKQRAPGGISCYDQCDLDAGHDGPHVCDYGDGPGAGKRVFSTKSARASWGMSPLAWKYTNEGKGMPRQPTILDRLFSR